MWPYFSVSTALPTPHVFLAVGSNREESSHLIHKDFYFDIEVIEMQKLVIGGGSGDQFE